jgi:cell division protein FtsL
MKNNLHIKTLSFHDFEERAFFTLVLLTVLSVSFYIYFVSATVLRVVDRTAALGEIKVLDTKISELESEYMAFGAMTDLSAAKTSGYEEIAKIDYVSRTTSLGFAR